MTRAEKIERAKELHGEGRTNSEIAAVLGVHRRTVYGWLREIPRPNRACLVCGEEFVPDHGNQRCCSEGCRLQNDRNRRARCMEKRRGTCEDCGKLLNAGSGWKSHGEKRCFPCHVARENARIDARAKVIEAWWAEGLTLREIADLLGWTVNHLGQEMYRLREKGYDLPYRYTKGGRAGHRFPEQVAPSR